MMASNMSESDESGNDVDDDEELIVPRPHYYSIWDCPHINKFTLEENGVVKNVWRCNWCMIPPAIAVHKALQYEWLIIPYHLMLYTKGVAEVVPDFLI